MEKAADEQPRDWRFRWLHRLIRMAGIECVSDKKAQRFAEPDAPSASSPRRPENSTGVGDFRKHPQRRVHSRSADLRSPFAAWRKSELVAVCLLCRTRGHKPDLYANDNQTANGFVPSASAAPPAPVDSQNSAGTVRAHRPGKAAGGLHLRFGEPWRRSAQLCSSILWRGLPADVCGLSQLGVAAARRRYGFSPAAGDCRRGAAPPA